MLVSIPLPYKKILKLKLLKNSITVYINFSNIMSYNMYILLSNFLLNKIARRYNRIEGKNQLLLILVN